MFRQGYDALDGLGPEGPRAAMNFVSFQRDLQVVQHVTKVTRRAEVHRVSETVVCEMSVPP